MVFDKPLQLPVQEVVLVKALITNLLRISFPLCEDWGRLIKLPKWDAFIRRHWLVWDIFLAEVDNAGVGFERRRWIPRLDAKDLTATAWEYWGDVDIAVVRIFSGHIAVDEERFFIFKLLLEQDLPVKEHLRLPLLHRVFYHIEVVGLALLELLNITVLTEHEVFLEVVEHTSVIQLSLFRLFWLKKVEEGSHFTRFPVSERSDNYRVLPVNRLNWIVGLPSTTAVLRWRDEGHGTLCILHCDRCRLFERLKNCLLLA